MDPVRMLESRWLRLSRREVFRELAKACGAGSSFELVPSADPEGAADVVFDGAAVRLAGIPGLALVSGAPPEAVERHGQLARAIARRQDAMLRLAECLAGEHGAFLRGEVPARSDFLFADVVARSGLSESELNFLTRRTLEVRGEVIALGSLIGPAPQPSAVDAVKRAIREIIAGETSGLPLSDAAIQAALAERDILVDEETVAKLRSASGGSVQ